VNKNTLNYTLHIVTMAEYVGMAAAGFVGSLASNWASSSGPIDFWNNWFKLPNEFVDLVDMMLIDDNRGIVKNKIVTSRGRCVPDIGMHYFCWKEGTSWWNYIKFEKKKDDDQRSYYMIFAGKYQKETFTNAVSCMFKTIEGKVRVIHIDTSLHMPFPVFMEKKCKNPKTHQKTAIETIRNKYIENTDKTLSVLISGKRGVGKTYCARLLKIFMEENDTDIMVRLYDDFNPAMPGCNANRLVLQNSSKFTPVILVIDEINSAYDSALRPTEETKVEKMLHTQNKQTFNTMLDSITDTMYTIAIYTTELSPEDLYENEQYRSFFRKGRVDMMLKMTRDSCVEIKHEDLPGYEDG
jgi:hypothetical protein